MSRIPEWAASLAGVSAADFDRWEFVWGRWPGPWQVAAVLAMVGIFTALSLQANRFVEGRYKRSFLLALRFAAVALFVLIVFDPSIAFLKTREREESLAVMVDASQSMNLKIGKGESRLAWVKKLLENRSGEIDRIESRFSNRWYAFGGSASAMERESLAALTAQENRTLIGESIDDILRDMTGNTPLGILLFSDGADQGRMAQTAAGAGLSPVPIYPILLPEEQAPDAAILEFVADPYAFVRNAFSLRAKISLQGFERKSVNVTLRVDDRIVTTQAARIGDDGLAEIEFKHTPQRVGSFVYSVEIPTFEDEAVIENNRRQIVVRVVRDRMRVLQVVGEPDWDSRFLRRYLETDPNIDLISFMILRTRENDSSTPESELSLIPFPTRELFTDELKGFDLVIFQNFDYRPYFNLFPGQLLDNLRRFVKDDGGGFLMIGGALSFASGGYAGTPLAEIIPVDLVMPPQVSLDAFKPLPTEQGIRHPVSALDLPPDESLAVWNSLPPLIGSNVVGAVKPGAAVLLRHPTQKGADGRSMPVLAAMEVGKGRSMALTADSSWRWNFVAAGQGSTGGNYQRFWSNAIRWLVHDPEFGRVRLESDRDSYDLGAPMGLRCTVLDEEYRPAEGAGVELLIRTRKGNADRPRMLPAVEVSPGVFTADFTAQEGGVWEMQCRAAKDGKSIGEASSVVVVDELGIERKEPRVMNELLRRLAESSGGRVLAPESDWLAALSKGRETGYEIVGRRTERLWDNAFVLTLAAMMLSVEWLLRRRWGGL